MSDSRKLPVFHERSGQQARRSMVDFEESSGNVFADLGFPRAEDELVKAKLTVAIHQLIKQRGLTQTEAAELLGTTQPQVSALMRCRAGTFSIERLMRFLTALGQDVEITVRPKDEERSSARVSVLAMR